MKVLVVGGNGFLGSSIVKQAIGRRWEVVSISRSGKPFRTPAGHQPAWSASSQVTWKAADAFVPESYRDVARECDAAICTTGILLESNYKQTASSKNGGSSADILTGLLKGWRNGSPFDVVSAVTGSFKGSSQQSHADATDTSSVDDGMRYEKMNRDAPLTVANTFSATRKTGVEQSTSPAPFLFISAEDIFRPIISSRYIESKREAEEGLAALAGKQGNIRPVFLRPGLMYHPQTRPLSTLPAAALDLSSWLHHQHVKLGIPLPTLAAILQSIPGPIDLSAIGRLLTLQPLHVDTVAKAACEALVNPMIRGAVGTEEIQELAGFRGRQSEVATGSARSAGPPRTAVKPWPSQRMSGSAENAFGTSAKRTFSTSSIARRARTNEQSDSASGNAQHLSLPAIAAVVVSLFVAHKLSTNRPLHNEAQTPTQQDQMRARATTQGVYAWGSNRYNVVAPDTPLTTFIKSPRSIPYFDGMALRDLAMEERHGVAVDANGDILQWGLGFFDASLENLRNEAENLDDVPLARRREREKANELTPRGSLGAYPMPPVRTLTGKDIVKVAASDEKVYALSRNGKVYVFSSVQARQWPGKAPGWSWNPFSLFGTLNKQQIDHAVLDATPAARFKGGERIVDIQAGSHHLLALSSAGRTFSTPIDHDGNVYGQLGLRRVLLGPKKEFREVLMEPRMLTEAEQPTIFHQGQVLPAWALPPGLEDKSQAKRPVTGPENRGIFVRKRTVIEDGREKTVDVLAEEKTLSGSASALVGVGGVSLTSSKDVRPHANIRFCLALHEVPALRDVKVAQIAAGSEHSIARTTQGKILGWGRQTHGQTGMGAQIALEAIPSPSEIVLSKAFPNSSVDIICTDVCAGADNTFFVMQRREPGSMGTGVKVDLLSVGKGQWGTLGNAMWNQVTVVPARVKTVSGLMEYSEQTKKVHPVPLHSVSVGKPGSVAVVLDTVEQEGHQAFGRDVMVFGHNAAYQLGTGKRANLAVPQHLQPLPPPTAGPGQEAPPMLAVQSDLREADINSGVLTHMPHHRLQLASVTRANTRAAPSSEGKPGKVKQNVHVEESITVGAVSMAIFWRIE